MLLCFGACVLAQSQLPRGNAQQRPNTTAPETPAPTPPTTVNQIFGAAPDAIPEAPKEQSYIEQFKKNALTDPIVLLTVVLAVCAAIQIRIYFLQLRTTHRMERAYIHIANMDRFDHVGTDQRPYVSVKVKNYGRTPARILAYNAGYFLLGSTRITVGLGGRVGVAGAGTRR